MDLIAVVRTDAGMHALWDVETFASIDGYDAWASELEDDQDIIRHVHAGHLVPINIRSDGAYCIAIRTNSDAMPALSGDEQSRVLVGSDAYRLRTSGRIAVSGIEYVGRVDERVAEGSLDPGSYDVVIYLLDYDDVPERGNEHPDFVVTVGPALANVVSAAIETFRASTA